MRVMRGFTLMEMIIVMVILGVVSVGLAGVIRFGTQIFTDVSSRNAALSDSRFALERLNREVRTAVPNSIRVAGDSNVQCVEFMPMVTSTFYETIPLSSPADNFKAILPPDYVATSPMYLVVFPLSPNDVYDASRNKRIAMSAFTAHPSDSTLPATITMPAPAAFASDSSLKRLYIVSQPVSFCVRNQMLYRYEGYAIQLLQPTSVADLGAGVLMAQNIGNELTSQHPFTLVPPTLAHNAYLAVFLRFMMNDDEVIEFNNEIYTLNAP
ncbi:PilW family protein [Neptunicella marina]|uniref:Type II secretion system protein n=1 Tax=Neptunicella marina TaxID=2125989 RepID=A0A8J6ITS5_9ALTE|nr:type II secretion system protein [Neptunicella marina]MBC3766114.1 type II secretion system protein [Neptunicella marina]